MGATQAQWRIEDIVDDTPGSALTPFETRLPTQSRLRNIPAESQGSSAMGERRVRAYQASGLLRTKIWSLPPGFENKLNTAAMGTKIVH